MDPTQAIAWHEDDVDDHELNNDEIPHNQILASLIVSDKEKTFDLNSGTHSIGRTNDNKVVLPYPSISKRHALLEVSKSSNSTVYCFITDCGSLNKTRLCRSADEKGIVLTPHTRYEILPGSKLIFGDIACQLTCHAQKEPAPSPSQPVTMAATLRGGTAHAVFKKPVALEATQAYEVTDEELLNDLSPESREVVPKRRASKWSADHATQPYEESETTTLGSMNNTVGNASLKSDSSTLWFKKDKGKNDELPSTLAYDEEATQGYDKAEIKVVVTQVYDEPAENTRQDEGATQAYNDPPSPAKPKDTNATQVYEETDVTMKDANATLAYEEPNSPVKVDNNATQAYEEPSSPVKLVDNNATQAYEEPTSPIKTTDYNNVTQAYEEPVSTGKMLDNNATLAYEEPDIPVSNDNNATQAYEEPSSPVKAADNNNATQAYDEPYILEQKIPLSSTKIVKFDEPNVTQVYEEPKSAENNNDKQADLDNVTQAYEEPRSPAEVDNNATLPIVDPNSPEPVTEPNEEKKISKSETNRRMGEDSNLFHDSHHRDTHSHAQTSVNQETRHSDSSDTQGPPQKGVIDNEATLMIIDSTEIKNNESMEATLQLPSTPPTHASADSLSDEAVESMPSDLWFIKHKEAAENTRPLSDKSIEQLASVQDHGIEPMEKGDAGDEHQLNNATELEHKAVTKPRRTVLRKSLSPTRARTKIEPEEQEANSVKAATTKENNKPGSVESHHSATESIIPATEMRSMRGRRKSKSEASAELEMLSESQTSNKRNTRRSSNVNSNSATMQQVNDESSLKQDSQDNTPHKANKRKLSQSVDDSPRASKRGKTSPEAKSPQSKPTARRKRTTDEMESEENIPRVLFTGFSDDTLKKYSKTIETLGGHVITDLKHVTECTHLVADSAHRTVKFLAALNCVKHVVSSKWIEKCQKQHTFVEEASFVLRDHTAERKFDFHLETSLQRASERKVFDGVQFVLTPHVKPVPEDLTIIIIAAGGQCIKKIPKKVDPATVVIGCAEDLDLARTLHAQGLRVYTSEFVLSSVIRQEINYEENLLSDLIVREQEEPRIAKRSNYTKK